MLRAEPKNWFSWDYRILDGNSQLTLIDLACFRESASFVLYGGNYKVTREGFFRGTFTLEKNGALVACAVKPNSWKRQWEIEHGNSRFTLKAKSSFGRSFVLLDGDTTLGSVYPDHPLTRRASVDLPAGIPLPVQVFITFLAVILWKRASDSGASGA